MIPVVESIDEGDHKVSHLPWVATVWERGIVTGDDHPCLLLVNYGFTLSDSGIGLPCILVFPAPNQERHE